MLTFPFGMPITPVRQADRDRKEVFVLGVYASAVHARWISATGATIVNALAVASEPEIFWRGEGADGIVAQIEMPAGSGKLVAASPILNGPSGITLDERFIEPLGLDRTRVWLCDLLPESRCNPKQAAALEREYLPLMSRLGLPSYDFPPVPATLASDERIREIEREILSASPEILVTLGDQPLKWFARRYGACATLAEYGETVQDYGRLHHIEIAGHSLKLLPLVHPRQAGRLGSHSPKWRALHEQWISSTAPGLLRNNQQ